MSSDNHKLWEKMHEAMGGYFQPPGLKESEMAQVGAKYPMMLYGGGMECIVYDDEDYAEAKKNGFHEHPAVEAAEKSEGAEPKKETVAAPAAASAAPPAATTTVSVTATKTTQPGKK